MNKVFKDLKNILFILSSQFKEYIKFVLSNLGTTFLFIGFALLLSSTFHLFLKINSLRMFIKIIVQSFILFIYFVLLTYTLNTSEQAEFFLEFINRIIFLIVVFVFIGEDIYPSLFKFMNQNAVLKKYFIDNNLLRIWLPIVYVYANSIFLFRKSSGHIKNPNLSNIRNFIFSLDPKNGNEVKNLIEFTELFKNLDPMENTEIQVESKLSKFDEILQEIYRVKTIEDIKEIIENDPINRDELINYIDKHL